MNMLGKLFVVLIFVMSLVFMAFSIAVYSTHRNWREEAQNVSRRLQTERATVADLQRRVEDMQQRHTVEVGAMQESLAKLETEAEQLRAERAAQQAELAQLVERERQSVGAMQATQQTLEAARTELTDLRTQIRDVQREKDEQFQEAVRLTDELNQAMGQLDLLRTRQLELTEQIARQRVVLDRHGLDEFEPVDHLPPAVDGIVLAVGRDGLVEISIGSDDGLRRGHTLEVYRRGAGVNKYLGRIEVVRADPDRAAATIIPEYRKGIIQREDRVATRLN